MAAAQRGGFRFQSPASWRHVNPPYDGGLTFTRIRFGGYGRGGWDHDYPQANRYLPLILDEVTTSDRGLFQTDLTNDACKPGVNYIICALTH